MFKKFDKAPRYTDFRRMFDKEEKNIDAVIVATPDFMHAICSTWAMERGKHVYCQKPLTRTIWEARLLTHLAAKYKVATQMGNQGYSNEGTRQCAEMIWDGAIGNVDGSAGLDQSSHLAPGPDRGASRRARAVHNGLGSLDGHLHRRAPIARPLSPKRSPSPRSTGADSTITAAEPSATWPATSSARRTWR